MAQRHPVWRNIAILAGGGAGERLLGAVYRVVLARAAGPVALGLITFCLPLLRLGVLLGTLGLPQALVRMVAAAAARREEERSREAFLWSLRLVAVTGAGLAVMLAILAPYGRFIFSDPRVVPLLRWLAPILFCDCLTLVLQANFQGRSNMWPVALAGVLSQGVKLAVTVLLIGRAAAAGAGAVAKAALVAVALSEIGVTLLLLLWSGRPGKIGSFQGRELLGSSLPLLGDGLVFAIASSLDVLVIPRRLAAAGLASEAITSLLGQVWGMALPTIFLPMVIAWPIAAANLPLLAAAAASGDRAELRRRVRVIYLSIAALAAAATAGFLLLARPLVTMLYACPPAAPYLRLLAWGVCPIYLASVGGSILVGLGRPGILFRQSLVCVFLRTSMIFTLTGLPRLGISGAIIGICAGNAALALANGWSIHRLLRRGGMEKNDPRSPETIPIF